MTTHTASWADTVKEADRKPDIPCTRCGAYALEYCVGSNGKPLRQIHAARAAEVAAYRAKMRAYQLVDSSLTDAQRDAREAAAQDAINPQAARPHRYQRAAGTGCRPGYHGLGSALTTWTASPVNRAAALIDGLKETLIAR